MQQHVAGSDVPAELQQHLRATKPWVKFMGILALIGAGLFVLGGLFFMIGGDAFDESLPAGLGVGMGFAYILAAALYIFPGLFLVRYGGAIDSMLRGGGMPALVEAMRQQKSFWRFVGITTAIVMGLYVLIFVVAIIAGISSVL